MSYQSIQMENKKYMIINTLQNTPFKIAGHIISIRLNYIRYKFLAQIFVYDILQGGK